MGNRFVWYTHLAHSPQNKFLPKEFLIVTPKKRKKKLKRKKILGPLKITDSPAHTGKFLTFTQNTQKLFFTTRLKKPIFYLKEKFLILTRMKGDFTFDCVNLMHYKCHKKIEKNNLKIALIMLHVKKMNMYPACIALTVFCEIFCMGNILAKYFAIHGMVH